MEEAEKHLEMYHLKKKNGLEGVKNSAWCYLYLRVVFFFLEVLKNWD